MDQRNKAALWGDMHFGPSFALSAQGSYSFTLLVPYLFDIDSLKADWQILPVLKATAGRFVFSDFTGHVLNHKLDGLALTPPFPLQCVTAGAGYSGFLLKPSSLILMTRSDSGDQSDSSVFLRLRGSSKKSMSFFRTSSPARTWRWLPSCSRTCEPKTPSSSRGKPSSSSPALPVGVSPASIGASGCLAALYPLFTMTPGSI